LKRDKLDEGQKRIEKFCKAQRWRNWNRLCNNV